VTVRIAVFASGAGSNLEALLAHFRPTTPARAAAAVVSLVVSNRPSAGALAIAARHEIATAVLPDSNDGRAIRALLDHHGIGLVALAGYLKRIPAEVTEAYRGRAMNVHPALLPAFGGPGMYGAHVHRAVLAAGVRVTGVTVHFVDAVYDHGPIIAQWPVPVGGEDTAASLAARVLRVEHALYPRAVQAVVEQRVVLGNEGRVRGSVFDVQQAAVFSLDGEEVACR